MAERPRLKVLDDPLKTSASPSGVKPEEREGGDALPPRPPVKSKKAAARKASAPAVPAEPAVSLGEEPLQAIFGRVPKSLTRRLEGAVYELRGQDSTVRQQHILAALLWKYVEPSDEDALKALAQLVDDYQGAIQRPRRRP